MAPFFLLAFGLGMVAGTWVAGRMADWSVMRSMFIGGAGQGLLLLLFSVLAPAGWWTLPVLFGITLTGSVLVVALQLRLMAVAEEAQTMGAAMNHAALNVANALGAWLGGLVIAAGWGYRAPGDRRCGARRARACSCSRGPRRLRHRPAAEPDVGRAPPRGRDRAL